MLLILCQDVQEIPYALDSMPGVHEIPYAPGSVPGCRGDTLCS
jgi:hypothetical protein